MSVIWHIFLILAYRTLHYSTPNHTKTPNHSEGTQTKPNYILTISNIPNQTKTNENLTNLFFLQTLSTTRWWWLEGRASFPVKSIKITRRTESSWCCGSRTNPSRPSTREHSSKPIQMLEPLKSITKLRFV